MEPGHEDAGKRERKPEFTGAHMWGLKVRVFKTCIAVPSPTTSVLT